jgi:hypothetical protein
LLKELEETNNLIQAKNEPQLAMRKGLKLKKKLY